MALKLNGTSGYLQYPNKVASTYPFSMMLWVNTPYTGAAQQFINQAQSTAARSSSGWLDANGATVYAQTGVPDGSSGAAQLSPTLSTSSLKVMLVVFVSASTRRIYYNSSTPGVQTYGSVDDSINYDVTTIGAIQTNNIAATGFAVASIAEAHFFNVALTDADYTTLAGGALPETVSGWVDGWSLQTYSAGGTYNSLGGTRTLTAYGGVTQSSAAHPLTRTAPASLSAPTQTTTGSTTATVGATTDTAPTATVLSVQVLPAATAVPTAAAIVAAPTQTLAAGAAGARTFALTGLTVNTAYRAHFAQGSASNVVSTVSFTPTDTTPPTLTGSVTISGITATSATASWPAGADNVSVASYETSLDGTTWTNRGNVLTYGFTGLGSSTAYTVSVRAKDAAGNVSAPPIAGSLTTSVGPATATTLTGPSGGTVGSASAPFTVGLNGTGTSAITPSDSGAGGTFAPSGAQTVTYPAAATFTYTAASAGTKTISTTNSSSLTNPTALTYNASATVGTLTILGIANNTGTLLAGVTLPNVVVIQRNNRALLLALTNQILNGSGNLVIASGALPAGTACQVAAFENDGSLGGCWAGTVV